MKHILLFSLSVFLMYSCKKASIYNASRTEMIGNYHFTRINYNSHNPHPDTFHYDVSIILLDPDNGNGIQIEDSVGYFSSYYTSGNTFSRGCCCRGQYPTVIGQYRNDSVFIKDQTTACNVGSYFEVYSYFIGAKY